MHGPLKSTIIKATYESKLELFKIPQMKKMVMEEEEEEEVDLIK